MKKKMKEKRVVRSCSLSVVWVEQEDGGEEEEEFNQIYEEEDEDEEPSSIWARMASSSWAE